MKNNRRNLVIGSALLLLGLTVIVGWMTHQPALIQLWLKADGMPYSTAAGFVLAGALLIAVSTPSRPGTGAVFLRVAARIPAALLILLGIAALVEWQAGIHVGLSPEVQAVRQWFADPNPFAGRMRPLAALSFIAAGMVGFLLPRVGKAWAYVAAQTCALLIVVVGCLAILGHLVGFGVILGWYLGPVLTAGMGFVVLGWCLSLLLRSTSAYRLGDAGDDSMKISLVAGATVVVAGLGGILGGFGVLYPQAVGELQNNLVLSLKGRSDTLRNAIQQGWLDSHNFGNQPLRLAAMNRLNRHPGDAKSREEIRGVAERYRSFGFSGVVFEDAAGREVARAGGFLADAALTVPVATPAPSELLWRDGYVLRARVDMTEGGQRIGRLTTERRLAVGEELHETRPFGASLDFAVCAKVTGKLDCFPLRSTAGRVLRQVSPTFAGEPLPMTHALAGQTGLVQAMDYRGTQVIAAHAPLGNLGLGTVLKIDAAELYQPIAQRLGPLFFMLLIVASAAVVLVRLQVVPLARAMSREIAERRRAEARIKESEAVLAEITATLGEGVYVLDQAGRITFVNPEAERLLGWPDGSLIGRDAHDTFHHRRPDGTEVPASACPLHLAVQNGQPYQTLKDWFVRPDGSFLPVSVIARPILRDGQVQGSVASFEDITARLRIEETQARLSASLRGLSEVAAYSHLPMIEQFRRALAVGAEHLGLEFGIVSHIAGEHCEVVAQVSPPDTLADGQVFPLESTYCSITLAEKGVVAIAHMAESDHLGHPCYREFKLEAYIGAAIVVGDEVFGTVNFGSPQPFDRGFDDGDREFVSLLARWAGSVIERHRNQEARRLDTRRIRALLDASDESVLLLAPNGDILAINAFGARRFGETPDGMVGRNFFTFLPPALAESRRAILDHTARTGEPIRHQDQRQGRHFSTSLFPVSDEHGEVESIAIYAKDVTDSRLDQQVEELFRHLDTILLKWRMDADAIAQIFCDQILPMFALAAAWIGRVASDSQMAVVACTGAGAGFLDGIKETGVSLSEGNNAGLPVGEVVRSGNRLKLSLDDPACGFGQSAGHALGVRAVLVLPLRLRGAVWGVLTVYGRDRNQLDDLERSLGSIAGRLSSVLEAALQQEWLNLLDAALAGVSNAVMITDAEARILWVNKSLTALTGYSVDEILGNTPRLFSSGLQDEGFYRNLRGTLQSGQTWRGEMVNARPDGSRYTVSQTLTPLIDGNGQISHYVAIVEDISERKAMEERIHHAAHYDVLTDLPNRSLFFDRLAQAVSLARRTGHSVALLFLDLDRFKEVNDAYGHEAGDILLQAVSERLRQQVRESDTVARLAGDEFTVILPRVAGADNAMRVAEKIIAALGEPFAVKGHSASIGVSIGIALSPVDGESVEQLLNAADHAMYEAKQAGRNTACLARTKP